MVEVGEGKADEKQESCCEVLGGGFCLMVVGWAGRER